MTSQPQELKHWRERGILFSGEFLKEQTKKGATNGKAKLQTVKTLF